MPSEAVVCLTTASQPHSSAVHRPLEAVPAALLGGGFLLRAALRLACRRTFLPKADPLGHFGPRCRVVRGHHREVFRKAPLLAVLLRRESVARQMALHRL